MPSVAAVTIPLQLACQFLLSGQPGYNNISLGLSNATATVPTGPYQYHRQVNLPPRYESNQQLGVAYKNYNDVQLHWDDARKRCISDGGRLAIIDTPEKFRAVEHMVSSSGMSETFLGIHSLFNSNEWVRVDNGSPVGRLPAAVEGSFGNCLGLRRFSSFSSVTFNRVSCTSSGRFICEIPL
ncbi:uncharacterized protein LOC105693184 [Athalia rosae]|uniref:uncharacterized protein LOC105693184 n=1 Tax=Athalia rosae TaxID=37344 RepID=UPI0020346BD7|nr:uncharacterized protein LOC105693184 [Athalia rosae]